MKYYLPFFLLVMITCVPSVLTGAEKQKKINVQAVGFQRFAAKEVVRIELSDEVAPKIFELSGEKPRIVIDFHGTYYPLENRRIFYAWGKLVNRIRVGRHSEPVVKTRVVIDIAEDAAYSYSQQFDAIRKSLVITIVPEKTVKENEKAAKKSIKQKIKPSSLKEKAASFQTEPVKVKEKVARVQVVEATPEKRPVSAAEKETAGIKPTELAEKKIEVREQKQPEKAPVLLDIKFEKNTNGDEMVLFYLNGFYPPVVYSAEAKDLYVVCDFLEAVAQPDIETSVNPKSEYIRGIKLNSVQEPKKVRVVVELSEKYTYDVKQVFFKENNLFVVILDSLGEKRN